MPVSIIKTDGLGDNVNDVNRINNRIVDGNVEEEDKEEARRCGRRAFPSLNHTPRLLTTPELLTNLLRAVKTTLKR